MRRRVHAGCGIDNPFRAWTWVALIAAQVIVWPVILLTGSLWACLGYLPWVLVNVAVSWWEHVHAPGTMYRTWWP